MGNNCMYTYVPSFHGIKFVANNLNKVLEHPLRDIWTSLLNKSISSLSSKGKDDVRVHTWNSA
jgi:hypothetical protein